MKNLKSEKLTQELTQEILKEILHYDPLTGVFTWKERQIKWFSSYKNPQLKCNTWNTKYSGRIAGNEHKVRKAFYYEISITLNKIFKNHFAHRLAFLYTDGEFPPADVDHIDGNSLNNKLDNLRKVSKAENNKNRPMQCNNTSGYTGISWDKQKQKWRVAIQIKGKKKYGGLFLNIEDAIAKRKELEIEYKFHKNHGRKS